MSKVLSPDDIGVPLLEALGVDLNQGIVSVILDIRANALPTLTIEKYVINATGCVEQFKTVIEQYQLHRKTPDVAGK